MSMAFVSPRMSLKVWNSASDPYDHEQLADNFLKLDQHDHSSGRGVKIGSAGIQDFAINTNHIFPLAVTTATINNGAVTTAKLAGGIPDSSLASPNNGAYDPWHRSFGTIAQTNSGTGFFMITGAFLASAASGAFPTWTLPITAADVAVAGKTTKLRLRVYWQTNAAPPAMTTTFGLYPITTTVGGPGFFQTTLGTVVSGSTVAVTTPAATSTGQVVGADFNLPADGPYTPGLVLSAAPAASANVQFAVIVQKRYT